jgi:hypothetical protein
VAAADFRLDIPVLSILFFVALVRVAGGRCPESARRAKNIKRSVRAMNFWPMVNDPVHHPGLHPARARTVPIVPVSAWRPLTCV